MYKSATQILLKYVRKPWFTFGLASIGILCCLSGLLLLAAHFSKQAILHVQRGEYSTAIAYAEKSRPIVATFNTLTFSAIPDLIVWQAALDLPPQAAELTDSAVLVMQSSLSGSDSASVESVLPSLTKIKNSLVLIQENLPSTFLIQDEVPPDYQKLLQESSKSIGDIETILTSLSQGKQTWVVLLQNSEEIRATGGFPGSYVLLNFDTGMLREIIVEDIYDADGQFLGYVAAPPGIREYTSGDKGLRLPDANWWPDFPESAQTMMQFFALGDKNNIAGLVAINLDAAKAILEVTGPLLLPDYDVEVTKDNIGEVLRTERSEFFPGSIQKKHLLQLTLTQLKQKVSELDSSQKQALASALKNQLEQKEVQLFSTNPEIQDIFSELAVAGELAVKAATNEQIIQDCACTPIELAIVESNVGINKVNRYITRKHQLNFTDQQLTIETTFSNSAAPPSATELSALVAQPVEAQPRNGNGYLNYHRVLVSPVYTVTSITVGSTPVTSWDEEVITTTAGNSLRQIGVLIGVPEKSSNSLKIVLQKNSVTTPEVITIYKQSGISATTYQIITPNSSQQFNLLQDTNIAL